MTLDTGRGTHPRRKLTDLREQRATVYEDMKAIADRAQRESRDLHPDEVKKYEAHEARFDKLTEQIEAGEKDLGIDGPRLSREAALSAVGTTERNGRSPVLGREQRVRDWAAERRDGTGFTMADANEFCIGNVMRAMVDPAFRTELSEVETRALQVGVDASGGFITPEILSVDFIDKVRNKARVFEVGAQTVPIDSDKQSIPRLSADPTGAWRNENAAFAEGEHTFERVTFTPQSYGFIVKTSEELFQDMLPGSGQVIENAIVQTAALELDRVALRGTGTAPEPKGIVNQTGVELQSLGANGGTPTMANYITAVYGVRKDNLEPTATLWSARTGETFAKLVSGDNQPLEFHPSLADIPRLETNQIPNNLTVGTSTDCSEIYVGDWSQLLVGIRLGIQLRLLQERYADTGQFAWRVFMRADIQLAQPKGFVVVQGVRP